IAKGRRHSDEIKLRSRLRHCPPPNGTAPHFLSRPRPIDVLRPMTSFDHQPAPRLRPGPVETQGLQSFRRAETNQVWIAAEVDRPRSMSMRDQLRIATGCRQSNDVRRPTRIDLRTRAQPIVMTGTQRQHALAIGTEYGLGVVRRRFCELF